MEGHRDGEARQDEVGGVEQGKADALAIAEGAAQHELGGLQRALADGEHDKARHQKGHDDVEQRDHAMVDPGGQLGIGSAHAGSSEGVVRSMRPSASSGKNGLCANSQRWPSGSAT